MLLALVREAVAAWLRFEVVVPFDLCFRCQECDAFQTALPLTPHELRMKHAQKRWRCGEYSVIRCSESPPESAVLSTIMADGKPTPPSARLADLIVTRSLLFNPAMPTLALPSFFGRLVPQIARNSSFFGAPLAVTDELQQPDEDAIEPASAALCAAAASAHNRYPPAEGSSPGLIQRLNAKPVEAVMTHAQSVLKSGSLKKRSKQKMQMLWQQRFVVLEGAPTHVLVYYYASAERNDANSKPRGVVPLNEASAAVFGKDGTTFRVKAPLRAYEFRAASASDASEWVREIEGAAADARVRGGGDRTTATNRRSSDYAASECGEGGQPGSSSPTQSSSPTVTEVSCAARMSSSSSQHPCLRASEATGRRGSRARGGRRRLFADGRRRRRRRPLAAAERRRPGARRRRRPLCARRARGRILAAGCGNRNSEARCPAKAR